MINVTPPEALPQVWFNCRSASRAIKKATETAFREHHLKGALLWFLCPVELWVIKDDVSIEMPSFGHRLFYDETDKHDANMAVFREEPEDDEKLRLASGRVSRFKCLDVDIRYPDGGGAPYKDVWLLGWRMVMESFFRRPHTRSSSGGGGVVVDRDALFTISDMCFLFDADRRLLPDAARWEKEEVKIAVPFHWLLSQAFNGAPKDGRHRGIEGGGSEDVLSLRRTV